MRFLLLLAAIFVGCSHPACPGFERVKTGSLCRDVTTGLYVPLVKCDECADHLKIEAPQT